MEILDKIYSYLNEATTCPNCNRKVTVPTGMRENSINKGKYPTHVVCPKCKSMGERPAGSKDWKWNKAEKRK